MAKTSRIGTIFMWSAIAQGALLAILTLIVFLYGSLYLTPTPASVIAFGSAGIWLLVGYIMYVVMILGLGITALFYNYIEIGLGKSLKGLATYLGAVHLIFMNIGMVGATWLLIYAGYIGGAGLLPAAFGGSGLTEMQVHQQILSPFPIPIVIFIVITVIGMVAGGLAYMLGMKRK